MPDGRTHRGPGPSDASLFAPGRLPALRAGVEELSWLLGRGFAQPSALKLVGDRHQLKRRQREAVKRASCGDGDLDARTTRLVDREGIAGQGLRIDGFNVIITVEAALSGAAVFRCRDGCFRDIASIHGSYRQVQETRRALVLIGECLANLGVGVCTWYLDRPVSNSGRLRNLIGEVALERGWSFVVELVGDPDAVLVAPGEPVATSDSGVLDRCQKWFNLAGFVMESGDLDPWIIDLG